MDTISESAAVIVPIIFQSIGLRRYGFILMYLFPSSDNLAVHTSPLVRNFALTSPLPCSDMTEALNT